MEFLSSAIVSLATLKPERSDGKVNLNVNFQYDKNSFVLAYLTFK